MAFLFYVFIQALLNLPFPKPWNHIRNLQEDSKTQFNDLNMEIPEWIICLYDVKVKNANFDTFPKKESIEMTFILEAKSM